MSNTSDQTTEQNDKTRLIVGEVGIDTKTGIVGKGHSYDNGKTFTVDDTIYGRIYHADDHDKIWKGIQDQVAKVVDPAKSAADSAVSAADAAVASAQVTSDAVSAIASATAEAKQGANDAMSRALSAWDVATGAKEAVTDFDPLIKSAQSDASKALTQIADTANALSDAKTSFSSDVAEAKQLANTAQTTANSAVESASENARELASQANALSDARKAMDSGFASATELANAAQATANSAIKSAASVASDLTAVASQAKSNADGITKVTSDVGLLQTTVADNSGNISKIQETAAQIQQAVSDNAGNITTAKQTADSAVVVASDAKSNATVAVQTASGASVTAKNAQGDATTAITTAQSAVTQASDAKSNATIAVQTASEASVIATNAQGDASIAKQTASDASVQIKNAQGDISNLQSRAGKIEASVATNSGAIADVQATANELKASVADNSGNITVAKQTADSAITVASDAKSNATVAIQTASQASITASSASGQAASAVLTASGAMTTASDAKSNATVAVQTASGASLTATNAQGDATIAKQTASEATVQASNAESDFAQLSIRANKIEANVATNSGAIASVQQTASGLTTTVADIKANGGGVNLVSGTDQEYTMGFGIPNTVWQDGYAYLKLPTTLTYSEIEILPQDPHTFFYNLTPGQEYTQTVWLETDATVKDLSAAGITWFTNGVGHDVQSATLIKLGENKYKLYSTYRWPGKSDNNVRLFDTNGLDEAFDLSTGTYLKFGKLKFEEGMVSHDWSPAPDDLQNQFTQIKQSIDGVTTTINDPKTGLNATYQTAAGNSNTISSVKGDVTQLQSTANGLTSRVGNLESKTDKQQTAIDQNKNAITLKADQTTVNTLKGNVDQNTSTLKTQADQIQSKVSASDVTGMLNGYATQNYAQSLVTQTADKWNLNLTNLQTDVNAIKTTGGGVNLVQNTSTDIVVDDTANTGTQGWNWYAVPINADLQVGDKITVSVENVTITGKGDLSKWGATLYSTDISEIRANNYEVNAGKNGQVTITVTSMNDSSKQTALLIYSGRVGDTEGKKAVFHHLMVEEGTVAHTWSPAPSDLATVTAVANLSATVNGIQSQVYNSDGSSRITQLSGLIQSKVGTDDFNNLKQAVNLQTLDSADINNMKTSGHYFVHNLANNPVGGWVYVDVTGDGSSRIRQDVYQDNGTKHQYRRWVDTNWTDWEEGATYSEINQLKDAINLRVKSGDLISQINLQAGASLIQSDKLVLDANTTVITGSAFIPSAAIESLDASKLTFYGANNTYATMGASVAQYDDDQQKSTINLQYNGGIEIHSSNELGSILTMHDQNIRLAVKSHGTATDGDPTDQYSGVYVNPGYTLLNSYQADGTVSGIAIGSDESGINRDYRIVLYDGSKPNSNLSKGVRVAGSRFDTLVTSNDIRAGDWTSIHGDKNAWLEGGNQQIDMHNNEIVVNNLNGNSTTGVHLVVHGWATYDGFVEGLGWTTKSTLSSKTRIQPLDTAKALATVNATDLTTYQYKSEVAEGMVKRHAGPVIDDVHDIAQYSTPDAFVAENRQGRSDADIIGYLMGAVQELSKQLDKVKEKI